MHETASPRASNEDARVLVLTPVKDAARHLHRYVELLEALEWPREKLALGLMEGDSRDGTLAALTALTPRLERRFSRLSVFSRNYGFHLPAGVPRWAPAYQLTRRSILARSRNQLLFRALRDEDWVLWVDVDLTAYPADVLKRLIASGFDLVMPHCVRTRGGPSFDLNAWADKGATGLAEARGLAAIRLDALGGTMLLVRADLHRDGLVFPPFRYGVESPRIRDRHPVWGRGEVETEGLGIMAIDMGTQGWGMPDLEIVHASD